ncbi:hypothetical protein AXG93_2062s1050 [Marchantia polymorpha subsp. ruderalis]|uniref:glutathione transferase n=1 Tax=Marchantia polymorpha subsp. ruderalis TaxID=1480154 RepID=A0A176VDY9_MARPO|nr:hypothetical protein AXG93_2062s1050 [Marchantia polymorpha subsp. ruderalis]
MAIQIYGYAGSTCCGRVLLTLFEKNVDDYKISHVDLYKREHKSPEFLKHQTENGPIVQHDGQRVSSRTTMRNPNGIGSTEFGSAFSWETSNSIEAPRVIILLEPTSLGPLTILKPFGETPYVIDGDLTLFESRAIARTYARKYADRGTALYGSSPQEEALVEQWLEVEAQHYDSAISKIVYNLLFYPKFGLPCDHGVVAEQMAKFEAVLDVYEKRLSESKYLAGDFFSLADLSHITYTYYFIEIAHRGAVFDSRPHVKAWIADLFARPTTQKWLKLGGHIP